MDFKREIQNIAAAFDPYSVEVCSVSGYASGVKKILSFDKSRLVFLVEKNKTIEIKGENLCITAYVFGDVAFCGKISGAEIKEI